MKTAARPVVLAAMVLAGMGLAACTQGERVREIDWAKAALARNPAYEILATDETTGVFTVRDTSTGTVHTLRLEDLVAAPRASKAAALPVTPASAPAVEPTEPVENPDAAAPASDTLVAGQTTEQVQGTRAGSGESLAEGPGYSITRGVQENTVATENLEGPGYSITRHEPEKQQSVRNAEAVAANVEKRTDPIVCQGDRLMRIDGETMEFTGDAVIAEKGCDLYISNARIRAGGVGIIARQARVHIVNSTIGGTRGSYEVSDGAEIYVAQSTFTGVGRRFEGGSMNDLGGNSYETH
jgi:hypothetical protein